MTVLVGFLLLWAEVQKEKQERMLSELREQEWTAALAARQRAARERLAKESRELQRLLTRQLAEAREKPEDGKNKWEESREEKEKPQDADWDRRFCANSLVDLVVKEKQKEYADRNLKFDIRLSVPPRTKVSSYDLCSIFTNLIDNAAEACLELPDKERRVTVQAGTNGSYLYIRVQNPALASHAARPARPGHGLGTRILRELAAKNGGEYTAALTDGEYRADVAVEI